MSNGRRLNIIDSKWIFKRKLEANGQLRFKARLLDVKTAFLNGVIDEEIFMEIADGTPHTYEERKSLVCKLERALYGLRISPKRWNVKFTEIALSMGLENSDVEPSHPQRTPMETHQVSNNKRKRRESDADDEILTKTETTENIPYREAIGSLLYLAGATRPDISYTVKVLSGHQINPTDADCAMEQIDYVGHTNLNDEALLKS
ncbi:uncharacterized protein LOC107040515 [Diachasma alloeum]|uniref:uncharacterized protein LOC107040515 n=1 Tax=Diachasma alloeum TaxID=454923 RepID=UPI0007381549|nr:uncharacterized protein LOC107040515 [Diachasma alloeum]